MRFKGRRRKSNADEAIDNDSVVSSSTELPLENVGDDADDISSADALAIAFSAQTNTNNVDSIRADLLEDVFHSEVTNSDYSDERYDWGGNSQDISEDYWHFLSSFE